MACIVVKAQQYRFGILDCGGSRLQARRHFARLPDLDAWIIYPVHQQYRRIGGAVLDMIIRTHHRQALETIGRFHAAKFRDIRWPIWCELCAQCIEKADAGNNRREQIRALGKRTTDGNSAGASALNAEPFFAREFALDDIFCTGYQVTPGIGLGELLSILVPWVAELATAANVAGAKNSATLEPSH